MTLKNRLKERRAALNVNQQAKKIPSAKEFLKGLE